MSRYVLTGNQMKCPVCGQIGQLSRNESVLCHVPIVVHPNGKWEWEGETDVHWNTSDYRKDLQQEPEWYCGSCEIDFDAPDVKEGDKDDEDVENG